MSTRRARVAGATVPGAVHLRAGRPNQDSVRWLPPGGEGDRVVMAVSDGHGSSTSPRSGLGSAFAVAIATDVLWQLPDPVSAASIAAAVTTIATRWTWQVKDHLDRNPLTASELGRLSCRRDDGPGAPEVITPERPTVVYGATLLFAVVSSRELALGQLGDGDVVVVDENGLAARPLPVDERLMAHATTSLSDDDPVSSLRTRIMGTAHNRLVLLSSDGYANSFSNDEAFLQVGRDILRAADAGGIGAIRSSLPGWLAETTRDGAGDDIGVTVAVLDPIHPPSPRGHAPSPA
jgi:protein phosphatase 2C-like protein